MIDIRTLLLMDNDPAHAESFREALLTPTTARSRVNLLRHSLSGRGTTPQKGIWAIFANLSLPDSQGLDTFTKLLQAAPGVPTLILCGEEQGEIAAEAMRRGAKDYLLEGHIDSYSFARAIRNMAERKTAEEILFTEKERAPVTLNSIGDAVLSTDIRGKLPISMPWRKR